MTPVFVVVLASLLSAATAGSSLGRAVGTLPDSRAGRVLAAAQAQVGVTRTYDPAYVRIGYPGGDVAADRGICADVVVRAYRAGGLDLQRAVHEDMAAHFAAYPRLWGLRGPDASIDHRRVANLMTYFGRAGMALPVTANAADYRPDDVVAWRLPGGRLHVGVVGAARAGEPRPPVIHNIGQGAQAQDVLFAWPLIGHYRVYR